MRARAGRQGQQLDYYGALSSDWCSAQWSGVATDRTTLRVKNDVSLLPHCLLTTSVLLTDRIKHRQSTVLHNNYNYTLHYYTLVC